MKRIFLFFLLISYIAHSQSVQIDTLKLRQDYENLISNLEKNYVYFKQKDVDLDCIKSYYSNKIGEIKNQTEALLFFEYLLDEFYDSHLHLKSNNNFSYRLYSPVYVSASQDEYIISSYWKDQLNNKIDINLINAKILTFNGVAFNQLIENFPTHCQNKNNIEVKGWIANKVLAGRRNESRIITVKTVKGDIKTLDIDKLTLRKDSTLLSYKIIDDIGIIRINNSLSELKTKRVFKKALSHLKNTKGIILDLRNTVDGGSTNIANPIVGHFTAKKQPFQKYKNSKTEFVDHIKPKTPKYDKPLIVLVGRWTGSMGEGMASGIDGSGIGKVIGTEMQKLAGATKDYNFTYLTYKYQAPYIEVLHISGLPREKFVPKVEVICDDSNEDEFLKEGIRIIKQLTGR